MKALLLLASIVLGINSQSGFAGEKKLNNALPHKAINCEVAFSNIAQTFKRDSEFMFFGNQVFQSTEGEFMFIYAQFKHNSHTIAVLPTGTNLEQKYLTMFILQKRTNCIGIAGEKTFLYTLYDVKEYI